MLALLKCKSCKGQEEYVNDKITKVKKWKNKRLESYYHSASLCKI